MIAGIQWAGLTSGLAGTFEANVEVVLPAAGVVLAAVVVFKAMRRYARTFQ